MPGKYNPDTRQITLHTEMEPEPLLTTTTLINLVVTDMLVQNGFNYAHFPEIVDLAVIGTGLGMLRSNINLVNDKGSFWDTTKWEVVPKPFLDGQSLAYANAIAAWTRDDKDPSWANDLFNEFRKPARKSIKWLFKNNDSFFQPTRVSGNEPGSVLNQSQHDWMETIASKSVTTQIVAIRHLEFEGKADCKQSALLAEKLRTLAEKLRTGNKATILNAITVAEKMKVANEQVTDELRFLIENRDDQIRAKAMLALTKTAMINERTSDIAVKMLDSNAKYVVFAGLFALASLETVPDHVIAPVNRGFHRALQTCNYEFIGLYTSAFNRWLEDAQTHFDKLFQDHPEFLEMATDSLKNVREQFVPLD